MGLLLKAGDTLSLGLDTARYALQTVSVKSYLESEKDEVTLEVTFARLRDGLSYPGNVVLNVPGQKIQVVIQNSGYQRVTPAAPAPVQQPAAAAAKPSAASTTALDNLLAPIALYPDALVAQILEASKDVAAVQKFAGWLKSNSTLKGTELQDAAQKAGFANCYIALAPFPQVIQNSGYQRVVPAAPSPTQPAAAKPAAAPAPAKPSASDAALDNLLAPIAELPVRLLRWKNQ